MSRRRIVALASTAVLLALGLATVALVVGLTQTGFGRDWVRRTLLEAVAPNLDGTLRVARISGNVFTGVTIDSLELRDARDSLFASVVRARVEYDPRDLVDRRVLLRHVELVRPVVHIVQHEGGAWNFRQLLKGGGAKGTRSGRGFGDFVVADSVTVRDGTFLLTMPWHPADSLAGARRDSAVRAALARDDAEIRRRTATTYQRTWRWEAIDVAVSYARLADPDSVGRRFDLARVSTVERDPPFRWRNVRGVIRQLGDSVWADVAHWELPGSHGTGTAKVWWGSGLPTRYAVRVVGDSVSLADVAWVYPTLPRTGGGRMELGISNDPRNLRVLRYAIRRMDVRTTRSRLTGEMTYGVGGPVLALTDVDLRAQPVDFDLLRTLNGGPFPYDWQGTLTGTVKARGGPLNRWLLDDARITYADRNVPGAVTRATARGGLDILDPGETTFRGLAVDVATLDLRTIQFLNPSFPRLGGIVRGTAVLDSSWLDVRFRDALLTHVDGAAPPSVVAGRGRVTYGETMRYDLDVEARPLSLTTLARSYPALPVRGLVSGPIRAEGTIEDLRVTTTLAGAAGTVTFDGTVDAFEPSYAITGDLTTRALDLRALLERSNLPATSLALTARVDARGSALADLAGTLDVDVGRSVVEGARVYGGTARLAFGGGRLGVDTLDVESTAGQLLARGGIGLSAGVQDSLVFRVALDSLGGLRRWLVPPRPVAEAREAEVREADGTVRADSLAGSLRLVGVVVGSADTSRASPGLRIAATLDGRDLVWGTTGVRTLDGTAQIGDALRLPDVTLSLGADSLRLGRLTLERATATFAGRVPPVAEMADVAAAAARPDAATGRRAPPAPLAPAEAARRTFDGSFALTAGSDTDASLAVRGRTTIVAESTLVRLDSVRLAARPGRAYTLATPSQLVRRTQNNQLVLDSLVLDGPSAARLVLAGALQDTGAVAGRFVAYRVAVADLAAALGVLPAGTMGTGAAADTTQRWDGLLGVGLSLAGTRAEPRLALRADARALTLGGVGVEQLVADGRYADRRLDATLDVRSDGAPVATATVALPIDLALQPVARRTLDAPLAGRVRADSLELGLLAALAPSVATQARGRLRAELDLAGTWTRPQLFGALTLRDGALTLVPANVRLQSVGADVVLRGDSLALRRVFARSGGPGDTLSLSGNVMFRELENPRLDLRLALRNFLAVDRGRLATLWVSTPTPLTVTGSFRGAVVGGAARLERGRIYIPELVDKRIVDLNDYRDVVDTTVFRNRVLLPGAPSAFVENLTLRDVSLGVGNDVWLRSPETNVKLGGTLAVTRAVSRERGRAEAQLALLGALNVERGTYRLNLLPLAQPVFDVEPGTLRFFGTGDLNPTLDIRAVHVVRQLRQNTNRPDVRVQVQIGGTLNQPTLQLSSADNPPIPDTDLIAYLVTGEPTAALFGSADTQGQNAVATSIVSRLAGSLVSGALSRGGPFDIVQVQTGGVSNDPAVARAQQTSFASILATTRLGVGGQLGQKTFYTFSTGFCGLGQQQTQQQGFLNSFTRGLGFRLERRVTASFSVTASLEPGAQELACLTDGSRLFFQQQPTQRGIDFSKAWSF